MPIDYQQLCELADREIRLGMADESLMHRALQQSAGVIVQAHQTYWRLRANQLQVQASTAGNHSPVVELIADLDAQERRIRARKERARWIWALACIGALLGAVVFPWIAVSVLHHGGKGFYALVFMALASLGLAVVPSPHAGITRRLISAGQCALRRRLAGVNTSAMRDPARIPEVLAAIHNVWKRNPDLRLGQIVAVATAKSGRNVECPEIFYLEDEDLLRGLQKYDQLPVPPKSAPRREFDDRFMSGDPIPGVRLRLNQHVRITEGEHAGREGFVISLLSITPEPTYRVERMDKRKWNRDGSILWCAVPRRNVQLGRFEVCGRV